MTVEDLARELATNIAEDMAGGIREQLIGQFRPLYCVPIRPDNRAYFVFSISAAAYSTALEYGAHQLILLAKKQGSKL